MGLLDGSLPNQQRMKVAILSTQDVHGGGGYIAAYRLNQGLRHIGVDSRMLVQHKKSDNNAVYQASAQRAPLRRAWNVARPRLDRLPLLLYTKAKSSPFSVAWLPGRALSNPQVLDCHIVNLHWVCGGFIRPEAIARCGRPIVWTLHDMWPFTGGCHYAGPCLRYKERCGGCPQLASSRMYDLSRWVWVRKQRAWRNLSVTLVAPSRWMAECAKASGLFRDQHVEVIPNGLNTEMFRPAIDKSELRAMLGLPKERLLVMFGAFGGADDRKGYRYALEAVQSLVAAGWGERIALVTFGSAGSEESGLGVPSYHLGRLFDEISLAACYASVDLFVCPSLEDNLPNTVVESLACGVPVVAFEIGGMPDMIDHKLNGYLARPRSGQDLASGIAWAISDATRYRGLAEEARKKAVRQYSLAVQAGSYKQLFEGILASADSDR